jgi:putative transposase
MPQEFVSCLLHVVFSTSRQRNMLSPDARLQLSQFMAAVAKSKGMKMVSMGGTENHVHLLLALPLKLSVESAILPLMQSSTTFLRQNFDFLHSFSWQPGFAAFSISRSQLDNTMNYIQTQEQIHWKKSFREEYIEFLTFHHLPFKEDTLFQE